VVWIPKAVLYNPAENPNTVKAWRRAIAEIPECPLRDEAESVLRDASGFPEVFRLGTEEDERGRIRFGSGKGQKTPPENPSGNGSATPSGSDTGNESRNGSWNGSGNGSKSGSGTRSRNQEQEQEQEQEEEGSGTPAAAGARRASPRRLLETWNENRGQLPEAKALPPGREKAARARLRTTPDLEVWATAVRHLASLPHLAGQAWVTIDFLLRPDSLTKIQEGKYDRPFRDAVAAPVLVGAHAPAPAPRPKEPAECLEPPPTGGGIWPRILEELRPLVDERDFDTWFRGTRQVGELNGVLRVAVASALFGQYVPAEYGEAIGSACLACGVQVPVEFVTGEAGVLA
jgi:hypothetical protein